LQTLAIIITLAKHKSYSMKKLLSLLSFVFLLIQGFSIANLPSPQTDSLIDALENPSLHDTVRAELLGKIGFETYTTDLESTKKYALELLSLSKEINYEKGLIKGYNLMGIYYDNRGDYAEALTQYQLSLLKAEQIDLKSGISAGLNNVGMIYEVLGNYPQALDYYQKSLKIDVQRDDYIGIANSFMNIGNIHENLGDNTKAMLYYRKCLNISDSLDTKILVAYSLLNIGYIHNNLDENDRAKAFYKESLEISEANNQLEGILLASLMMGILDKEENNHLAAEKLLNKALQTSIKLGSISQERYCYFHLAEVKFNQKNYNEALKLVKLSYVEDENSDENLKMNNAELLSEIYAATHDYEKAYQYHVLFKALQDHSFNEKNIQETTKLEYHYKNENEKMALALEQQKKDALIKAEHERQKYIQYLLILISVLLTVLSMYILFNLNQRRKANRLLLEQKQQLEEANHLLIKQKQKIEMVAHDLEKANETKDKFFSIIAHDLRSPFTTILGFSNILLESHEEFDKSSLKTFLSKIKNGSETALILLENLFSWARSNSGDIQFTPKQIALEPLVKNVCNLYENGAISKQIALKCQVFPGSEIFADEEMLTTILRNLISNAIKFTPKKGEIIVSMSLAATMVAISVKDNGIGMNKEQIKNLFELNKKTITQGSSGEKGTGLGLVLCHEFTQKHKGEIKVISKEGVGTEIIVLIPKVS